VIETLRLASTFPASVFPAEHPTCTPTRTVVRSGGSEHHHQEDTMPVRKESAPTNDPFTPPAEPTTDQGQPVDAPADKPEADAGYHDSLSGRPVTADGHFVDDPDADAIPEHRIVANDWADRQGR
jgi:hypothetical protein